MASDASLRARRFSRVFAACLVGACLVASGPLACSATIWNGPAIAFTKDPFADPALAENQDRITDTVWITRDDTRGIYNAVSEGFYGNFISPAGTRWAVGTTESLELLTFSSWEGTVGLGTPINGPPNAVGVDFVLHLVEDDIYLDLQFTEWGVSGAAGGSFSYIRSTAPIPEPAGAVFLAVASLACCRRKR